MLLVRHFEERSEELEELKRELEGRVDELGEENDHLKRQLQMESEAKSKLRQETSQLTADNMVCDTTQVSECLVNTLNTSCFSFQDFEEQLDQKDRLIKKLQKQMKSLETSQRGSFVACAHVSYDVFTSAIFISVSFLTQQSKRLRLQSPKTSSACWSTRERMNPDSFKTSFWVFVLCILLHSFCDRLPD